MSGRRGNARGRPPDVGKKRVAGGEIADGPSSPMRPLIWGMPLLNQLPRSIVEPFPVIFQRRSLPPEAIPVTQKGDIVEGVAVRSFVDPLSTTLNYQVFLTDGTSVCLPQGELQPLPTGCDNLEHEHIDDDEDPEREFGESDLDEGGHASSIQLDGEEEGDDLLNWELAHEGSDYGQAMSS